MNKPQIMRLTEVDHYTSDTTQISTDPRKVIEGVQNISMIDSIEPRIIAICQNLKPKPFKEIKDATVYQVTPAPNESNKVSLRVLTENNYSVYTEYAFMDSIIAANCFARDRFLEEQENASLLIFLAGKDRDISGLKFYFQLSYFKGEHMLNLCERKGDQMFGSNTFILFR